MTAPLLRIIVFETISQSDEREQSSSLVLADVLLTRYSERTPIRSLQLQLQLRVDAVPALHAAAVVVDGSALRAALALRIVARRARAAAAPMTRTACSRLCSMIID